MSSSQYSYKSLTSSSPSSESDENKQNQFSSFEVSILNIESPASIFVRGMEHEDAAHGIDSEMSTYFEEFERDGHLSFLGLASLTPGRLCALHVSLASCSWHRALLLSTSPPNLTVRLLDRGITLTASTKQVFRLPDFLADLEAAPPMALRCHLFCLEPGQEVEGGQEAEKLLARAETIVLHRRGAARLVGQGGVFEEVSLPVDLVLCSNVTSDPFGPREEVEESLIKLLKLTLFEEDGSSDLEKTVEESPGEEEEGARLDTEFSHVLPMAPSREFQWLPACLPGSREFLARGTYVDDSGQIHLQLNSQRETVRVLRRLLNEKLSGSGPDCQPNSYRERQEVSVRWKDDCWYRGSFLAYCGMDDRDMFDRARVLLVDFGNVYVVNVATDLRSAIYGERVPVQSLRAVLHNVLPAGEDWKDSFLDYLNDTINYAQPGYNVLIKVKVVEEPSLLPLPVTVETSTACSSCEKTARPHCRHSAPLDLALLLTGQQLGGLGAVRAADRAALSHLGLREQRSHFSFSRAVAAGTYKESSVWLLLLRPSVLLLPPGHFLPALPSLCWQEVGLLPGSLLQVMRIAEVPRDESSLSTVFIQPWGEAGGRLGSLVQHYLREVEGSRELQESCEGRPPVMKPRAGLPCVVRSSALEGRSGREVEWYRGEVLEARENCSLVRYVDWGTEEWVQDSQELREMPAEWLLPAAMAVRVELEISVVEEDRDLVLGLLQECLLSREEECWVRIEEMKGPGHLAGHIVSREGRPIYQGLVREGVIKIN